MRRFHQSDLEILGVLGQGARGAVLSVRDRRSGATFAKRPLGPGDREELVLLARLRHPNLVSLAGIVEEPSGASVLTGLVSGGDLGQALRSGIGASSLLADALRGLAFLHARGVVHGDLKPQNLLVDEAGLRIADLDLARPVGASERGGTPAYMAPERLAGAPAAASGDLYGLGAAFAIALGAPLPSDLARAAEALHSWVDDSAHPLAPLLGALLAASPAARPTSARAASRLLASLAGEPALCLETEATARAYLRPSRLAGRDEVLSSLVGEAAQPGVVRVRAAPGAGGTRLLEELAVRLDSAVSDPRDAADPFTGTHPVLLDDADAADEKLASALVDLQRKAAVGDSLRVAFVLVRPGSALDKRLAGEGARSHVLPALSVENVASMVAEAWPGRGDPTAFSKRLHAATGGAPARVVAALAAIALRPDSRPGALGSDDLPDPSVLDEFSAKAPSEALSDVLRRTLTGDARELAGLLAVARRPVPAKVLHVALGADAERFDRLVRELDDRRLVRAGAALSLDGEQLRAAVDSLLATDERASLHGALFAALADVSGEDALLLARADRVHHARGAGLAHEAPGSLAVELLSRSFAREAADLLRSFPDLSAADRETLARALASLGELSAAVDEARRAGAALLVAEVLVRQGDYVGAVASLEAARTSGPDAARDALLARALALSGRHERSLEVCDEALAGRPSGPAAIDLAITRALAHFYKGDLDAARDGWAQARTLARDARDKAREANAVNGLGLVAQRKARFDEARHHYESALELAESCGDRARVGTSHLNLGTVLQELGRTREAAQNYRRSSTVARLVGERVQAARARSNLANLLLQVGRLADARAAAAESRRLAEDAGAGVVAAYAVLLEGESALVSGATAEALEILRDAEARFDAMANASESVEAAVLVARARLAAGERDAALESAKELAGKARKAGFERHEVQALLLACEAQEGRSEGSLALAHQAFGLALATGRPDLAWRAEALLAISMTDGPARASHASQALERFERAAAQVDEDDRPSWVSRPDRARLKARVSELARTAPDARSPDTRLSRLLAINRRLGTERNLRSLLDGIVDQAVELCGAERGFVLLAPDSSGGPLNVMVARNIDGESLAKGALKVSHSIAERVIREEEPELTLDAQQDERYQNQLSVAALKLRSVVCVPLRLQGKVLGALYIDNRFRARAFGPDDLAVLESFADQASIALGQVRALEEARAAREEAERARGEIEALNRRLSDRVALQEAEIARARREADEQRLSLASDDVFKEIVGTAMPMRRLKRQIERVAATDLTVLVTGESGTGKELVARALFAHGSRRDRPFVSVNCGALSEGILESELFGHVRGSFTGADRDREGLFQVAHTGTLFLDEVGDMGPAMQVKLLRALQEGEIRKVGGKEPIRVDVRVVAATNRDLSKLIQEGKFREDLFYRLNVVSLVIPPLRERLEDLPLLCARLLSEVPGRAGPAFRMSPDALDLLARYPWPGNVRELRATLHNAALFAESELLEVGDFSNKSELFRSETRPAAATSSPETPRTIEELELDAIRRMLELTKGNKSETARRLGIDRKTLYNKLARLRLGGEP